MPEMMKLMMARMPIIPAAVQQIGQDCLDAAGRIRQNQY